MELYPDGDYVSAIPGLEKAMELDPTATNISFFLGACYLLTGRTSEGIETLQHTVALGDTVFLEEAHLLLAKAHLHRGEFETARTELETVIGLGGDVAPEAQVILDEFSEEVPSAK
jgi:tetratricopeptide (TPR) repeat protein